MTLESQVCSLELAKKLKELGVKQVGYFVWCNYNFTDAEGRYVGVGKGVDDWVVSRSEEDDGFSAFTVAELLEELQTVAKQDILIASDNTKVADWLAQKLIDLYAQKSKV